VEKKKYDLCLEVLRRMKKERILDKIMLVGSWCILLYDDYFKGKGILPAIRTRDLEFLISIPPHFDRKIDLFESFSRTSGSCWILKAMRDTSFSST
jgi:hypothetical protein